MSTIFRVGLRTVGGRVKQDSVVNRTTGGSMVMNREVRGVAGDALATTGKGRGDEGAIGGSVMAGGATLGVMDLASTDEG